MTKVTQTLGEWGEKLAADHLVAKGMVVLDRNWRTASGEIDIIARDGDAVVFCEVKTRRSTTFGDPGEAVAGHKANRIRTLAKQWLALSGVRPREVRFDLVKVMVSRSEGPVVSHLRGIY
ncbi:MAG TPA: YraN family protein [Candidatus Limnocylindrales bacterium]